MPRVSLIRSGFVALLVAVVLAVIVAGCGSELSTEGGDTVSAPVDGNSFEAPDELAIADVDALAPDSGEGGATTDGGGLALPQLVDRKIIRTATFELEVEAVGAAVQEVESIAVAAGGFVSGSSVFIEDPSESEGGDDGAPRRTQAATVTIRVPAEAYRNVVSQLRGIAEEVRSESSEASEVTEEYTDLQARLRNLEATEASYLELLTEAETIPDILTVQDRINSVRLEIEQVQGRINLLDSLTELATITVQLKAFVPPAEGSGDGRGWASETWEAAWEASEDTMVALGRVAIVGGVVLAWLAVPALVIAVLWRLFGWRLFGPRPPRGGEAGGAGTTA